LKPKDLIKVARNAQKRAFAPYSKFRVGAALLTKDKKVYTGCNVEISTYALTLCAERTAIFKAISEGEKRFTAIAVVSDDSDFISPCGACRQVLMDLAGDIDVIMTNSKNEYKIIKLGELLPYPFGPNNLLK
jgi:cytidine deaminase